MRRRNLRHATRAQDGVLAERGRAAPTHANRGARGHQSSGGQRLGGRRGTASAEVGGPYRVGRYGDTARQGSGMGSARTRDRQRGALVHHRFQHDGDYVCRCDRSSMDAQEPQRSFACRGFRGVGSCRHHGRADRGIKSCLDAPSGANRSLDQCAAQPDGHALAPHCHESPAGLMRLHGVSTSHQMLQPQQPHARLCLIKRSGPTRVTSLSSGQNTFLLRLLILLSQVNCCKMDAETRGRACWCNGAHHRRNGDDGGADPGAA
jgi:hypothetical protein